MDWIKVEDESPRNRRSILLCHNLDDSYIGIVLGFYDLNDNTYKEKGGNFEIKPSHWCAIKFPTGENE